MLKLKIQDSTGYSSVTSDDFLKQWKFPCGEAGIKLQKEAFDYITESDNAIIEMSFESNDDLFALAQLVDALRQNFIKHIGLTMKYVPYGRQDRRCFEGEGHALKVFAKFINDLKFSSVVIADAHSSVTHALFDNLQEIPQEECAQDLPKFDVLIAPDAGAEKKVFKHKQVAEGTEVICASKTRDSSGKITSVYLPFGGKITEKRVCIVDDLCDGGATFLELGKVVKEFEPAEMCLYVTHGMFTKPDKFVEMHDMFDRIFVYNMSPSAAARCSAYVEQI
jgi:ribose-phosphate pyrophosphokinase